MYACLLMSTFTFSCGASIVFHLSESLIVRLRVVNNKAVLVIQWQR